LIENFDLKAMTEYIYIIEKYPLSDLTSRIGKCAIEVYKYSGNGFQKSILQLAMNVEFAN
jgi:hypothetical protein